MFYGSEELMRNYQCALRNESSVPTWVNDSVNVNNVNVFIRICLSLHGSRSVEKLLEKVTTREQRGLIMSALTPGAIVLSKDVNGHRVVFNCLKNFPHADTEFQAVR
ncbi:pumilio-family RNA-binding repeatprotein [Medicago truncatula]|uniref:Pumilio-family RNA-binding repeatprotein n=1 Tax=Medicago truncatula TaxID=3880 RepID=G7ZVV7_MEDTR|nr:pumilio-family RNA-binding repeatprotein [Medicago truncatula]